MTPHVNRLRRKVAIAAHQYRIATSDRLKKRKVWVMATASLMRAEINALKRKRKP